MLGPIDRVFKKKIFAFKFFIYSLEKSKSTISNIPRTYEALTNLT